IGIGRNMGAIGQSTANAPRPITPASRVLSQPVATRRSMEGSPGSRLSRRKSHGPNVDFMGNDVSFANPAPQARGQPPADDSDDDSDDGRFAMPIRDQNNSNADGKKPNLTVDTRAKKTMSVSFASPQNSGSGPDGADGDDPSTKSSRRTPATPSEGWESNED